MTEAITDSRHPKTVLLAVWAQVAYALLLPVRVYLRSGPFSSLPELVAWAIGIGYLLLLAYLIYKRRNWARWWMLLVAAAAIISSPFFPPTIPSGSEFVVFVLQWALGVVVIPVLLLLPSARAWFRPNNSFKPKPLRGSA